MSTRFFSNGPGSGNCLWVGQDHQSLSEVGYLEHSAVVRIKVIFCRFNCSSFLEKGPLHVLVLVEGCLTILATIEVL
jgi:hypothetical protein